MKWLGEHYDNVYNCEFDLTQTYETFKLMWLNEDNNLKALLKYSFKIKNGYIISCSNNEQRISCWNW